MTAPLTPPDCDLRGMPFMALDVVRLRESDFSMIASGDEFKAAILLWCASWNQVPAASLPNDDRILAGLARLDGRRWGKVKAIALHGYVLCDDGRLYHPVVAEKALEAWEDRIEHRASKASDRERKRQEREDRKELFAALRGRGRVLPWNTPTATLRVMVTDDVTDQSHGQVDAGHEVVTAKTGTGTGIYSDTDVSGAEPPPINPEKKAWDDAVSLLTTAGRMKPGPARAFIGKLKSDNGIDAKDLLPAIGQAIANGTQDPVAYLSKAASGISQRRGGGSAAPAKPDEITRDDWIRRVGMFRQDGMWLGAWGPRPGERGCICPSDLLEA